MSTKLQRQHFWKWFQQNNKVLLSVIKLKTEEADYWANELDAHLKAFGRAITFTIFISEEQNINRLTITSRGAKKYFKKIDDLVAIAPDIPEWEIHALEEAVPLEIIHSELYGKYAICLHELYFMKRETSYEDDRLTVDIYHPLYSENTARGIKDAIYTICWHLLGERSFGGDVRYFEIFNLSDAFEDEDYKLFKLEELPDLLGKMKSAMSIDPSGAIRLNKSPDS